MRFQYLVLAAGLPLFVGAGVKPSPAPGAREIVATMVDPSANFIWQSVSIIVTADGVEEKSPRNDREWGELREAATLLAEGGSLLKKDRPRAGDSDWMKWSQAIVDAADTTLEAVDAKNAANASASASRTSGGRGAGFKVVVPRWRVIAPLMLSVRRSRIVLTLRSSE